MPRITDSPGQIFESSDEATQDHTYAQKTDVASPSLPEATSDIIPEKLTETCVDNEQGKSVVQLSDATSSQHTASTLLLDETEMVLCDATSTSTYELLDETSTQGAMNKQLPEVTITNTHELPDKTVPLVTGNSQLPEVTHTRMQVQSDETISSVPMNNQ